jgi:hypothetical protein
LAAEWTQWLIGQSRTFIQFHSIHLDQSAKAAGGSSPPLPDGLTIPHIRTIPKKTSNQQAWSLSAELFSPSLSIFYFYPPLTSCNHQCSSWQFIKKLGGN